MKLLIKGLNHVHEEEPLVWALLTEATKGVKFPCWCHIAGYADLGRPYVKLPNGEYLSIVFLQL